MHSILSGSAVYRICSNECASRRLTSLLPKHRKTGILSLDLLSHSVSVDADRPAKTSDAVSVRLGEFGFRLRKHFDFLRVGRVAALTENFACVFPTDLPFLLLFDQEK